MVMLMRTLLFPVDNGMGTGLSGDGYAAEYDLWTGKIIWRQISDSKIQSQRKLATRLSIVGSSISPLLIMTIVLFINTFKPFNANINTIFYKASPIILGIILFVSFEILMLAVRNRYPLVQVYPEKERQYKYFTAMLNTTIRRNETLRQIKTPYLATYSMFLITFMAIPLSYYFYLHPGPFIDYLIALVVTSILISLVPNFIWNVFLKQIIYYKLIRKTKGDTDE